MSSYSSSIVSMARPYLASFPRYSERLVENRDFSYSVCTSPGGGGCEYFRAVFFAAGASQMVGLQCGENYLLVI